MPEAGGPEQGALQGDAPPADADAHGLVPWPCRVMLSQLVLVHSGCVGHSGPEGVGVLRLWGPHAVMLPPTPPHKETRGCWGLCF